MERYDYESESPEVLAAREEGYALGVAWAAEKGEKIIEDLEAQNAALLAALEVLVSRRNRDERRWMDKHYEAALAAINKTKGGE